MVFHEILYEKSFVLTFIFYMTKNNEFTGNLFT